MVFLHALEFFESLNFSCFFFFFFYEKVTFVLKRDRIGG